MKIQNKKYLFFSLILLSIIVPVFLFVGVGFYAPFEVGEGTIAISGNDVIKNFKIDSFDGMAISAGGTSPDLGNKLKFETASEWKTTEDDIQVISVTQVGTEVFLRYRVVFTIKVNIYTNMRLPDVIEPGKSLDPIDEEILAGVYGHYNSLGYGIGGWDSHFSWNHLDVGNVRDTVAENGIFSGNLIASFDIDDTPFPSTIVDVNGNSATKNFAYISVASAYVGEQTNGLMSDDMPSSVGLTPAEYEEQEHELDGGDQAAGMYHESRWDPQPEISEQFLSDTVDFGIQYQSSGSTLDPKTRDGQSIWDPTDERSMTDCKLTYNLGSLSPLVKEYSRTLNWYYQHVKTQEYVASIIPWSVGVKVTQDLNRRESETRTVALHVTNRYVQTEFAVAFDVYTSYEVEAIETDMPELQEPEEYYDDLVFNSAVDGFGGGYTYVEGYTTRLFGGSIMEYIMIIIIVVIIGVAIYLLYKRYKKKQMMQTSGTKIYLTKK